MKFGMQVGLGPGHIVLDGDPAPPPPKGHSPQFLAHICCGQMAAWIKMSLGMELRLGPGDFVLDGDPDPYPKRGGAPPSFRTTSIVAKRLHGSRCHLVQSMRHCVRCGPSYPQKKGTPTPTQFLAHVYCGQMAGWMKTPLGTEVDLGSGHIVLDGVPAPTKGAQQPPSLRPMSIVATVANLSYC